MDDTGTTLANAAGVQSSALAAFADMDVSVTNTIGGVATSFDFNVGGIAASANGAALGGALQPFDFTPLEFPQVNFGGN